METLHGKHNLSLGAADLHTLIASYESVHIDLGTGDGRFVRHAAHAHPERLVIGIDACREGLWNVSRRAAPNALFVIANAEALPAELSGVASLVTINFPWGSLLSGLLRAGAPVLNQLASITRPEGRVEIRLNGGALNEAGCRSLRDGAARVRRALAETGFDVAAPTPLSAEDLRACPSTWAKRLAFGRDPSAVVLSAGYRGAGPAQRDAAMAITGR